MIDRLPVWAIRPYTRIWVEGDYKIIQTHKTRYVLDVPSLEGNYWERRLKALDLDLPYKLYPIKKRFEFVEQLLYHSNKMFIDSEGKLITYKPSRSVKIHISKVTHIWEARNGELMFRCRDCPRTFRTQQDVRNYKYLAYFQEANKFYMYKLCNSPEEVESRKRL